jgi:hypothetical protein
MRPQRPLVVLALLAAGCDLIGRPPIEQEFGAPYHVLLGAPAEAADLRETPYLDTDGRLVVVVAYTGGCADHLFGLDYVLSETEARLWIIHDDPGDVCTEALRAELAFEVNEAVLARPRIVLAEPSGRVLPLQAVPAGN